METLSFLKTGSLYTKILYNVRRNFVGFHFL